MMSQNSVPFLIPLKDTIKAVQLIKNDIHNLAIPIGSEDVNTVEDYDAPTEEQICFQAIDSVDVPNSNIQIVSDNMEDDQTIVYQVLYPEDFDLKPTYNTKRGRPKRKKITEEDVKQPDPPKTTRTRSGRLVKLPKHIEMDFKKIEITDDELELKTTEFVRFEEKGKENCVELKELENHQRKRTISSQYRCPKCQKAYLGKAKMMRHLQKYPDHGPLPEKLTELNFDVWNYLVDITQKSPPGRRGDKFCEELTNLLHNVQLLTTALFKKEEAENNVHVDKVLGNAIGLNPGKYRFDENELYKDVTVLKLIANLDFFNPKKSNNIFNSEEKLKNTEEKVKNAEQKLKNAVVSEAENKKSFGIETSKINENFFSSDSLKPSSHIDFRTDDILEDFSYPDNSDVYKKAFGTNLPNLSEETESMYSSFTNKDKIQHMESIENTTVNSYSKKSEDTMLDNRIALHTDLLSENSLLNALPHSSVDELIMSSSNLLDNSIGCDEVMNVDQFVNERFKKITEPDIDLSNGSLNLDLPSLDLFNFHTN